MVIEKAGLQKNCNDNPGIESSVNAFYMILSSAKFFEFPAKSYGSHFDCNFQTRWNSKLSGVMSSIPRGYTDVHLEHFK